MTEQDFFERVVQEVIRRLRAMQPSKVSETSEGPNRSKTINDRVVTLAALGPLKDVDKLVVRRDAVVTPSVRDELRQRKIQLERATA